MAPRRIRRMHRRPRARKRKGQRRHRSVVPGTVRAHRLGHLWPENLRVPLKTRFQIAQNPVTAAGRLGPTQAWCTYYGNGFGNGTTGTYGVGPQFDFGAGGGLPAFGLNIPASLCQLLSTPAINAGPSPGWNSPYAYYRVLGSSISARVVPQGFAWISALVGGQPSNNIRMVLFPSLNASYAGVSITTALEQPYAKSKTIVNSMTLQPSVAAVTSWWLPEGQPERTIRSRAKSHVVMGVNKSAIGSEEAYAGGYAGVPDTPWYWHMGLFSDGVGNFATLVDVTMVHDTILYQVNQQPSYRNL